MLRKLSLVVLMCTVLGIGIGMPARAEAVGIDPNSYISFAGTAGFDLVANHVDIVGPELLCEGAFVCSGTYDFMNFLVADPVTFLPGSPIVGYSAFTYAPFSGVMPLWSVDVGGLFNGLTFPPIPVEGVYTFDLTEILPSNIFEVNLPTYQAVTLFGKGIAHGPLLDDTTMYWTFQASTGSLGGVGGNPAAFSSISFTAPEGYNDGSNVPDGGSTAALLGSILIGFGIVRRRFFQN
jgi:hypothetical protein